MDRMTDEQIQWFKDANSEKEWNEACDRLKKAHGGYPSDWWTTIMGSGISRDAQMRFMR